MSGFRVEYTAQALQQLKKMDRFDARILTTWIRDNLEGIEDPYRLGKGLTGNRSGEWRYRVGQYRILCLIEDGRLLITVFAVGHRREVYRG